jgi:hypothetical protein
MTAPAFALAFAWALAKSGSAAMDSIGRDWAQAVADSDSAQAAVDSVAAVDSDSATKAARSDLAATTPADSAARVAPVVAAQIRL